MFTIPKEYDADIKKAIRINENEGCTEVYIFSCLYKGNFLSNSDIDITVGVLKPDIYFKVYGQLLTNLIYPL